MAFGNDTISNAGSAVQDLFAADAHRSKAKGLRIEAGNYDLASGYATQNEKFIEASTAIKQAQIDRSITQSLGGARADIAGSGLKASGTALNVLRDSAEQGSLTKQVASQQGLITEEGYNVQAKSYTSMGVAARLAADAEDHAATGSQWAAAFHAIGSVASLLPGG